MPPQLHLRDVLRTSLADHEAAWSMGSFGAIAEFHQDAGEPATIYSPDELTRATPRGAIRISVPALSHAVAIAYETPSPKPHRWSHGVALCLPDAAARRNARAVLTELGRDGSAIRPEDADTYLFDMGLALANCDFCIRTLDAELLAVLRANAGRSLFDAGNPAMPAILRKHPHRVAITSLGRVEVMQKIGGPETGGVSPAGPHTHVLPKLLRSGRTHSTNQPIAAGLTPCAYLYPGNPVIGPLGQDRPFAATLHEAFQQILSAFGPADLLATKARVLAAVQAGEEPGARLVPDDRHHRAVAKVALRQLGREAGADADRGALIDRWRARLDHTSGSAEDAGDEND